jgi:protein gp37
VLAGFEAGWPILSLEVADLGHRYGRVKWGPHGERKRTSEAKQTSGHRPQVFCASLADWLDNKVPREWRSDLGHLIEDTPELDWLLLTKRPENYEKLAPWRLDKIPTNVWLGISCENQFYYERRWAILSRPRITATVKFVSYEPALGPFHSIPFIRISAFNDSTLSSCHFGSHGCDGR